MNYLIFVLIVAYLISKIRENDIYYIPLLYLVITRFNSLIYYNSFTVDPLDFCDYFFIIYGVLYTKYYIFNSAGKSYYNNSILYLFIKLYIIYYLFLFAYSLYISNVDLISALKIGRYLFFGLIIFLITAILSDSPFNKFAKITEFINKLTVLLSVLFVIDSFFNINVFVIPEGYTFQTEDGIELKRNFYAYPFFSGYCILYNIYYFLVTDSKKNKIIHLIYLSILYIAMITIMTRGLLISTLFCSVLMFFNVRFNHRTIFSAIVLFIIVIVVLNSNMLNKLPAFNALMERMSEIKEGGIRGTSNFAVRAYWLNKAIDNVMSFNPLFGFGFTIPAMFGYSFLTNSAVNPDNAWANIIGVQGFVGLLIYVLIITRWIYVNLMLQRKKRDGFSRINLIYIVWALINTLDGNYFSFIYTFALFISYDLLCYEIVNNKAIKQKLIIQ